MCLARNGGFYSREQLFAFYGTPGEAVWNEAAHRQTPPDADAPPATPGAPPAGRELPPLSPAEDPTPEPLAGICGAAEPAEVLYGVRRERAPLQSAEDLAHGPAAPPEQPLRAAMHYLLESGPAPEPTLGICAAAEPAEVGDGVGVVALNAISTQ